MAAQSVALRFALACVSLASRGTAQGIPGTDCCPGTDPANTCYGWFQADASNVCPTDRMARSSCDCHQPRDAAGNIDALSMEFCCMNTCYLSGFTDATCPDGASARGEHDFHQPMNGEFTAEECCQHFCDPSSFHQRLLRLDEEPGVCATIGSTDNCESFFESLASDETSDPMAAQAWSNIAARGCTRMACGGIRLGWVDDGSHNGDRKSVV